MFKVGDKVRRTKGENELSPIGKELIIRSIGPDVNGDLTYWFDGGAWGYAHGVSCAAWELVQPVGPVVTETVTKTRIVPGTYDRVFVGEGPHSRKVAVAITGPRLDDEIRAWSLNADELDAAAAVLSALAKGLRDA